MNAEMDRPQTADATRTFPAKRILWAAIAVLALWPASWWGASLWIRASVDQFIANEASQGRVWTCAARNNEGFPFKVVHTCAQPRMSMKNASRQSEAAFAAAQVFFNFAEPLGFRIRLTGPAQGRLDPDREVQATWKSVESHHKFSIGGPPEIDVGVENLAIHINGGQSGKDDVRLDRVRLTLQPKRIVESASGFFVEASASGLKSTALRSIPQSVDGLKMSVNLIVHGIEGLPKGRADQVIDYWRDSGGFVRINAFAVESEKFSLEAAGRLELDETRRISGELTTRTSGLTSLIAAFTGSGRAVGGGGMLQGFFSRRNNQAEQETSRPSQAITMPLILKDGAVRVGPIRLPVHLVPIL